LCSNSIVTVASPTQDLTSVGQTLTFDFTNLETAESDVTVRVFVRGDVDGNQANEWYIITADPGGAGQLTLGNAQAPSGTQCLSTFVDANNLGVISITQSNFNNIISNDGSFTLSAEAASGVGTFCTNNNQGGFNDVRIELAYQICSGGNAVYSPTLGAPICDTAGITACSSGVLLEGKAVTVEPNPSNTLDGCSDGSGIDGGYLFDESIEQIIVRSTNGGPLQIGESATIEATVFGKLFYSCVAFCQFLYSRFTHNSSILTNWFSHNMLSLSSSQQLGIRVSQIELISTTLMISLLHQSLGQK